MDAPLALYRRYRPETFAQVIGQEHVTTPLRSALANNRVSHAYLFSGPRGCGKTTSARILARALNCEQGPTPEPCGECQSCSDLARGGPGSIDVIEIDAASHGGVDDARDLRERAFFAPVNSRYKVYIIDEAHMVTTQGFNALLKLVEEPPPHLKFIFATTEPEKVIGTIRSRTHHYPFRLIPPRVLSSYLSELCDLEGVRIEPAALPLVVRAGGGSARDTLSVLDQLLGGASDEGVTYELTTGLLGFTPDALLDEVVDAFAADDGGAVFGVVDKVIESGQDPRRFTEDLLRRLRDLVILAAVPDAPATGLIDVPEDQADRLVSQAARFGRADLTRSADLVAAGLTDMRGATAPRLLLELICARVLLPGADDSMNGVQARVDRLEKRMSITGGEPATRTAAQQAAGQPTPQPAAPASTPDETAPQQPVRTQPAPTETEPPQAPETAPDVAAAAVEQTPPPPATPSTPPAPPATPAEAPTAAQQPAGGGLTLADVRRLWPDVVEATKYKRRVTWIHLSQHAQVVGVDEKTLTLGFSNAGARSSFVGGGSDEILRQVMIDVIGQDWRVEAIVDPSAQPGSAPAASEAPPAPGGTPERQAVAPAAPAAPGAPPAGGDEAAPADGPTSHGPEDAASAPADAPAAPEPAPRRPVDPQAVASAREAIQQTRDAGREAPAEPDFSDGGARPDDEDADADLSGAALLERELGARVIEETRPD